MLLFLFIALVVLILAPFAGDALFRKRVARDVTSLLSSTMSAVGSPQLAARWDSLPEPVQRYLRFAIAEGAPATRTVRVEHGGTFLPRLDQKWLPIRAVEYFTAAQPGFVWSASVRAAPLVWINACDRLLNRRGNMQVKLESLFTIVDAAGTEINQGASMRWLAEAIWFPYAFVGDAIRWQPAGPAAAKATLVQEGVSVSCTMDFDAEGRVALIRGERYHASGRAKPVLTPWLGRCSDYRQFGPFQAPTHVEVAWVLEGVESPYARFDVWAIQYNIVG